jgi:hypothetical protein
MNLHISKDVIGDICMILAERLARGGEINTRSNFMEKPEWERSLERFRRPYKDNIKMNLEYCVRTWRNSCGTGGPEQELLTCRCECGNETSGFFRGGGGRRELFEHLGDLSASQLEHFSTAGKTCPIVSVAFLRNDLVTKFVSCAKLTKFIWKPKTQFLSFLICS